MMIVGGLILVLVLLVAGFFAVTWAPDRPEETGREIDSAKKRTYPVCKAAPKAR